VKWETDRYLSEARQKAKEILARGEKKEAEAGESQKGDARGREVRMGRRKEVGE
jgi:hypothetical protein